MWKATKVFNWYKPGDEIKEEDMIHIQHYLARGYVEQTGDKPIVPKEIVKEPKKKMFDFNGDGKVDKKDFKIAGKALRSKRGKK